MKVIKRRSALVGGILALCLVLSGLLAGCSSDNSDQAKDQKVSEVTVIMGKGSEPEAGFDPFVNWGSGEHAHEPLIQSTLITTDVNMNFVNDLATDYSVSEDGLQWTFTIRDDALFTDGNQLTAEDVAFTINGILASEASETDLSMVESAVAIDDSEVIISLNKPYNALLYTLAVIGIVPEHAYGNDYGSNPIGSGRYMLEQWDRGQQVILKANPDYYGEAPKMERVVIAFMDEDAALASAQAGQADLVYTAATYSSQNVEGYELFVCKSVDSRGISLPTVMSGEIKVDGDTEYPVGNDVTADIAIRKAINLAIDREAMASNVLNGYGTIAYSVCDGMPWASPDMQVDFDRDQAKSLLEENSWELGDDGVYVKDGLRAAFDVWYPSNDSVRQALTAEFANQMKEVGIEVTPRGGSWDDIYPIQFASPVLWGWGSNSPAELYSLYYSTGGGNYASYASALIDEYIDAALAQSEVKDSYEFWQKAQWDGDEGIAPQGTATWAWFVSIDHLYFKNNDLKVAEQKLHPHGHGWSVVNNVDQWTWAA